MERKLVVTHAATDSEAVGRIVGAAALKKAAGAVGNGIQDRRDEVIAYARRELAAALTAAAGFGVLVGLALAIGSRTGTGRDAMGMLWEDGSCGSCLGRGGPDAPEDEGQAPRRELRGIGPACGCGRGHSVASRWARQGAHWHMGSWVRGVLMGTENP
jgi:hypothetical protein